MPFPQKLVPKNTDKYKKCNVMSNGDIYRKGGSSNLLVASMYFIAGFKEDGIRRKTGQFDNWCFLKR